MIWHDITGLRVYQTPESIAWGIKEILRRPEHAVWMGENGRKATEEVFRWDNIAEETLKVYEELV
jgi:glycosyltransferase involved in cell wall biosynthesis